MLRSPTIAIQKQQHGVVLVVSLMILLVLTLLGISSLDGSIMEEKMAANAQTANNTFREAESTVHRTFTQEGLFDPRKRAAAAVGKAFNSTLAARTNNYSSSDITSSAVLRYPSTNVGTPLYNSSSNFVAHGIEIVGSANDDEINSTSRQGYRVFPMLAMDEKD